MTDVRVLFWDVRNGGTRRLPLIERVNADIVLLLAVSRTSARRWTHHWQDRYHCANALELVDTPQQRPHGAMIASRWPLDSVEAIDGLMRPERGLTAVADVDGQSVTVVSWGTPNARGDGYPAKMAAYRHMSGLLASLTGPAIVGVDTNSRYDPPGPASPSEPDERRADEHAFLQRDAAHGLIDVHRALIDRDLPHRRLLADLRPYGPLATTYIRRPHGQPRGIARGFDAGPDYGLDRMDRIFVTSDITPVACEHLYHEAIEAGGDHAAVIADLSITDSPRVRT